jgi:hypothetical protein
MPDVTVGAEIPAGNGNTVSQSGTLTMNNLSTNQDLCKNAHLLLRFTGSPAS